jgi:hypothetical protein
VKPHRIPISPIFRAANLNGRIIRIKLRLSMWPNAA